MFFCLKNYACLIPLIMFICFECNINVPFKMLHSGPKRIMCKLISSDHDRLNRLLAWARLYGDSIAQFASPGSQAPALCDSNGAATPCTFTQLIVPEIILQRRVSEK